MLILLKQALILADGGYSGFSYLSEYNDKVDLVILDLMMPDVHGNVIAHMMKIGADTKDIPIIISTGSNNEQEIQTAINCGADLVIKKPYTRNDIINAISKFKAKN